MSTCGRKQWRLGCCQVMPRALPPACWRLWTKSGGLLAIGQPTSAGTRGDSCSCSCTQAPVRLRRCARAIGRFLIALVCTVPSECSNAAPEAFMLTDKSPGFEDTWYARARCGRPAALTPFVPVRFRAFLDRLTVAVADFGRNAGEVSWHARRCSTGSRVLTLPRQLASVQSALSIGALSLASGVSTIAVPFVQSASVRCRGSGRREAPNMCRGDARSRRRRRSSQPCTCCRWCWARPTRPLRMRSRTILGNDPKSPTEPQISTTHDRGRMTMQRTGRRSTRKSPQRAPLTPAALTIAVERPGVVPPRQAAKPVSE